MKNKYSWLIAIITLSIAGFVACNSPVNKQVKTEPIETIEEFEVDSASYSQDTTVNDDEGIMEDTTEDSGE